MGMHPILSSDQSLMSGDQLNIGWSNDTLVVPQDLMVLLTQMGIRTAEQLASALVSAPSSFGTLGIPAPSLLNVRDGALRVLEQRLNKRLTSLQNHSFAMGARAPSNSLDVSGEKP